jgi:hypothetical protein
LSEREQLKFLARNDRDALHASLSVILKRPADAGLAERTAGWLLNGKAVAHEALAQQALLARRAGTSTTIVTRGR